MEDGELYDFESVCKSPRRFFDSNWWVFKRHEAGRELSLWWWTKRGYRSNWLEGWTAECLGHADYPVLARGDPPWLKAYRAGRRHCYRYI